MINKPALLDFIIKSVNIKIADLTSMIDDMRASNNDTKSSMGDKYETGREMLQQQINHLQNQLNVVLAQHNILNKINLAERKIVSQGSIVKTDTACYFIATSVGEVVYEKKKIFVISEQSPVALAMMKKSINDLFIFNNKQQKIQELY